MTAEEKCKVIKDVYAWAMFAPPNTALYMQERLYFVRNDIGQVVLVRAHSEVAAIEIANRCPCKNGIISAATTQEG